MLQHSQLQFKSSYIQNIQVYLQPVMAEELLISNSKDKEEKYKLLVPQIEALVESETDEIANMANIASVLKMTFDFLWVGFYRVVDEELVLAPFQGPLACTRIQKGKGVCGAAWERKETLVVEDVDQFPNHIACSSDSRSEIVVPIIKTDNSVFGVLDIDSDQLADFDELDKKYLEQIANCISKTL